MECDLWEATAKGVSSAQLRRWTAQIVGFYPYFYPSVCMFRLGDSNFGPNLLGTRSRCSSQHGHHAP